MEIKKPIFIVGMGRSGSTIFFDVFSYHLNFVWFVGKICERFPTEPKYNRIVLGCIRSPVVGRLFRRLFEPGECYTYWNYLYRGFGVPFRDLERQDVSNRAKERIINSFGKMITLPSDRLLIKITGWNRMRFLQEIFPDAIFIHVKRDPRAVINSFLNVDFWSGWRGPQNWRMGQLSEEQTKELKEFNYSFVALAGLKLEILQNAFLQAKENIEACRLLEIDYEDLCNDPAGTYRKCCEFVNMKVDKRLQDAIDSTHFRNTNQKFKLDLTEEQQRIVEYYFEKITRMVG